jgi:Rrf2 family protein
MKLSKRGEYALRALIDLGIAAELGRPIIQTSELAAKEKLPVKFLEQIFTQLKASGFVVSKRGKLGGYSLARPMNKIKFGSVIRMIDGPLAPISCVSETAYERCTCPDEDHCGLRMLMLDVRTAIIKVLDRYTLADIVEITLRKMRRDKVSPPFISRAFNLGAVLSSLPAGGPTNSSKRPTEGRVHAT